MMPASHFHTTPSAGGKSLRFQVQFATAILKTAALRLAVLAVILANANSGAVAEQATPDDIQRLLSEHCLECHDSYSAEGGLDLESLSLDLADRDTFDRWVLIYDRVKTGEMPPPESHSPLEGIDSTLQSIKNRLVDADKRYFQPSGRSTIRRLNRYEYENTLRVVLDAPWLQVADGLPTDGVDHLFAKSGERLDVSHVQLNRYLQTAERALNLALQSAAHPIEKRRFYAREEPIMDNYLRYRFGQTAATRSIVPLDGYDSEPDVIRGTQPITVGAADQEKREREAMGVFSGVYSATTKYDFKRIDAPTDGLYRLRFKTYTFRAGPNGASGGDDHGLSGGDRKWWRPDRNVITRGTRSEPVTLYALAPGGDSRWLTTFDSMPDPTVFETTVSLKAGENIRPDAARLVRTRPGWSGNPNADPDGVPGFAMNWLEVEGPLHDHWPPASYRALFDDLPFRIARDDRVRVISKKPKRDAKRLLLRFYRRAIGDKGATAASVTPYVMLFKNASALGENFTQSMIAAASAILCSPEFLYLDADPGPLSDRALNQRLAYFLWNGPPDQQVAWADGDASPASLIKTVDTMLADPRRDRFVAHFLDYWLDLRDINANTPDSGLYPDYYLDELLTESSVRETRLFFGELVDQNLPVRNLIDSDFAFVNERLARHYGLPAREGVTPRRVTLPPDSARGGLLTQASVLRVTANGTTTSPVLRGVWIARRILGIDIPPPPSGVAAVEPDIRGAVTIRQQLAKHTTEVSCGNCHRKFDPTGFALESFDVAGGWRERYRAIGDGPTGDNESGDVSRPVEGIGKNGHNFEFRLAGPVECAGQLDDGRSFADIQALKRLLVADDRQLARNLLHQLIAYSTGRPVSFADRDAVELMLDRTANQHYRVRSLVHEVVKSDLFRNK